MTPNDLPRWFAGWGGTAVVIVLLGGIGFGVSMILKHDRETPVVKIDLTIDQKPKSDRRTGVVSVTEAVVNGRYKTIFITAEHDGHLFIVNGRTTIHHPNCPCYGQPIKP